MLISYSSYFFYVLLSFLAGCFAFIFTSLGSGVVFLFKKINNTVMDCMLALSAGIMLSASIFSLIIPALEYYNSINITVSIFLIISFLSGGYFIYISSTFIDKCYSNDLSHNHKKSILLFFSIILHNIPEGLIIGIAFGSIFYKSSTLVSALILTLGIALQNFPEGSAISLPLKRIGFSSFKAFSFGVLSGIVEPIAAIIGALLILKIQFILPFIMLFTAGAMIYVIIIELIPESQKNKKEGLIAFINIIGFSIMMFLELLFS